MYFPYGDEKGMALLIALVFLALLTLAGTTAVISITTDTKITANYKASVKASYVAEAGVQEAKQRLRGDKDTSVVDPIIDIYPEALSWVRNITPTAEGDSYSIYTKYWWWWPPNVPSLQTGMDYTVEIRHRISDDSKVMFWGDEDKDHKFGKFERHTDHNKEKGTNIYYIKSDGPADGPFARVEVEAVKVPRIKVEGVLYVGISASIQGTTVIEGNDEGEENKDKHGIATPLDTGVIDIGGGASVTGKHIHDVDDDDPNIKPDAHDLYSQDAQSYVSYVDFYKACADFSYDVNTATHTASTTPGPWDGWGTPDLDADTPTCDACNIVYYDTNGTSITLSDVSGGVSGCGILVVAGDLIVEGDFFWYGTIIVTRDLTFSGDGDQVIQGAVLSGGEVDVSTSGEGLNITYNSTATTYQKDFHTLCILSWKDGSVE